MASVYSKLNLTSTIFSKNNFNDDIMSMIVVDFVTVMTLRFVNAVRPYMLLLGKKL